MPDAESGGQTPPPIENPQPSEPIAGTPEPANPALPLADTLQHTGTEPESIQTTLQKLARSTPGEPSPHEEAAIARAQETLSQGPASPDPQGPETPAPVPEISTTETPTPPGAPDASAEHANTSPLLETQTGEAAASSPEPQGPPSAETTTAAAPNNQADKTDATEPKTEAEKHTETEAKLPTEAFKDGARVTNKLNALGIDTAAEDEPGAKVIEAVAENPALLQDFENTIDKLNSTEGRAFAESIGLTPQQMGEALITKKFDVETKQLEAETKAAAESNDPAKQTEVAKKSKWLQILKLLAMALGVAAETQALTAINIAKQGTKDPTK